jgi:hypothetical protein
MAFTELPAERLVLVGQGPLEQQLRKLAGANVPLVGGVSDTQLRWLYSWARRSSGSVRRISFRSLVTDQWVT